MEMHDRTNCFRVYSNVHDLSRTFRSFHFAVPLLDICHHCLLRAAKSQLSAWSGVGGRVRASSSLSHFRSGSVGIHWRKGALRQKPFTAPDSFGYPFGTATCNFGCSWTPLARQCYSAGHERCCLMILAIPTSYMRHTVTTIGHGHHIGERTTRDTGALFRLHLASTSMMPLAGGSPESPAILRRGKIRILFRIAAQSVLFVPGLNEINMTKAKSDAMRGAAIKAFSSTVSSAMVILMSGMILLFITVGNLDLPRCFRPGRVEQHVLGDTPLFGLNGPEVIAL